MINKCVCMCMYYTVIKSQNRSLTNQQLKVPVELHNKILLYLLFTIKLHLIQ